MPEQEDFCPFVGLQPYTEEDSDYFFGRERDQRIIASNLFASPLTILYGASGVGKTSVLLAGVIPDLRKKYPEIAIVSFREWQNESFLERLKSACIETIESIQNKPLKADPSKPLDDFLKTAAQEFGGSIVILFDQFEEYFLYHQEGNDFEAEFARAVNREDEETSFLLSMREDGLSKLDRFSGRIPTLMSNMLRLESMNVESAENAIRETLRVYNALPAHESDKMTVEDELVKAILSQVRSGQVHMVESTGTGQTEDGEAKESDQIETPFLQLVLTRLWKEEHKAKSDVMRLKTLERLGGAKNIVGTHLDSVMDKLSKSEKEICARFFDRLVTPSGSKIAFSIEDLTKYAGNLAGQVPSTIAMLIKSRLLKSVAAPLGKKQALVEIYHDVLAPAILAWRNSYVQAQQVLKRRNKRSWITTMVFIFASFVSVTTYQYYSHWLETRTWGYLSNAATGKIYDLSEDSVTVGRSTDDIRSDIGVISRYVSRRHLLLEQSNGKSSISDMRSLNGTTVNASFLPYGKSRNLMNGDVVVLAGVAAFKFTKVEYSTFQFSTPSPEKTSPTPGWGMFIDGESKTVIPMQADQYYLSMDAQNRYVLDQSESSSWLLKINRLKDGTVTAEDRRDGNDLLFMRKESEYSYPEYRIYDGEKFSVYGIDTYHYENNYFQIVSL